MESEELTPARFADTLNVGRAIISHILNGRNKPSLDIISRILESFPSINPDWLLFGAGSMYRDNEQTNDALSINNTNIISENKPFDLFTQPELFNSPNTKQEIPNKQTAESQPSGIKTMHAIDSEPIIDDKTQYVDADQANINNTIQEKIVYKALPSKKITQIIIYYDDNTFEVFNH